MISSVSPAGISCAPGALRAPQPGGPFVYVTTRRFLEVLGLAYLRELPDLERLEDEGLLQRPRSDADLDGVLGLFEEDAPVSEDDLAFDAFDAAEET
jgi:segregation and condensation protein B